MEHINSSFLGQTIFFLVSWYIDILLIHSLVSMETLERDPFPSYNLMGQNFLKMITFSKFDVVACSKSLPGPRLISGAMQSHFHGSVAENRPPPHFLRGIRAIKSTLGN